MSARKTIHISQPFFDEEETKLLQEVMGTGWVTQGPKVRAFEEAFAAAHEVPHAVAVTSCTTAMHLALAAWDIGPGDEVIVPAFTWIATPNVVLHCGATPVLVDVDPKTYNLRIDQVADKVTDRTKAIIPVHLFGLCADIDALRAALPREIPILEDAACGSGARYRGRFAGGLGEAAAFSFHPRKTITTGEGGMITTRDAVLAEKLRTMRNHGASISEEDRHHGPRPYSLPDFHLLGYNYRMTDLQGAIGLSQVAKLAGLVEERARMAERYNRRLSNIPWLQTPATPEGYEHGWQAYVCYVDPERAPVSRNRLMERLQDEWGISCRPGTHAVNMLHFYQEMFGIGPDSFPGARDCHVNTMALPLHNRMSEDDLDRVIEALHSF